jgi:hypothetical protein
MNFQKAVFGDLRISQRRINAGLFLAFAFVGLSACGGGGGGGGTPTEPAPAPGPAIQTTVTLSGIVAKGAAFNGASVLATNSTGSLNTPVLTGADGAYSITLPADVKLPIILTASKSAPTGETESYATVVTNITNSTANITPITNVITALLSSSGNPNQLATQISSGAIITQASLNDKTSAVQSVLKSAIDALGVANIDPIRGNFSADGNGYSKLLDSVNATLIPNGNVTNIEIALRIKGISDSAQPPNVQFAHNQASLPVLPAVTAANFVADGTASRLTQLMTDAQACYALPLSSRISAVPANSAAVLGTGSNIAAPLCKGIFTGNDPTKYLNSGVTVGRDAAGLGAFAALFTDSATGVKFDSPQFEYVLSNGDIGFSFRTTLPGATATISSNVLRLDPTDQKLKFVGDQYQYSGRVLPVMERREFPVLNQAQWNYLSTGYSITVPNTNQFEKVDVVAPTGVTYSLLATPFTSFLVFSGKGPSSFLRLRSEFVDTAKTASVPSKLISEVAKFAFETVDLTDQVIAALPAQSVWTFRYFKKGNTGTSPDAVQVYRTRGRALTIAEFRGKPNVSVNSATQSTWIASASTATGRLPLSASSPFSLGWSVPSGSVPPISAIVSGSSGFSDLTIFSPTTLATTIACKSENALDIRCEGASNGGFRAGSEATGVSLIGVDISDRNIGTQYGFLSLTIAP